MTALTPYRGRLVVWAGADERLGTGIALSRAARRPRWAGPGTRPGYFEEAIELEQQIGALPYLAHSLGGLAGALALRASAGDAGRASEHRSRAREIAERLGMTVLLERLAPPAG